MALRLKKPVVVVGWVVAGLLLASIAYTLGAGTGSLQPAGLDGGGGVVSRSVAPEGGAPQAAPPEDAATIEEFGSYAGADKSAARSLADEDMGAGGAAKEPMIIRNESIDLRVQKLESAVDQIRAAARKFDADITQLSVSGGDAGPKPLAEGDAAYPSPGSAYITLRVAADKLDELSREIAKTGSVLSQSSGSDDVTEQYVDLAARLKNLKAEEARLRGFFERATKVSDLLAVERELARVRGEIEAMQAQIDYLERQVARATLTVSLSEPGPVVQPGGPDWGFEDAVRRGVQAAVAVVTTFITLAIALAPLLVLAGVAWLIVRWIVRRRRARTPLEPSPEGTEALAEGEEADDAA